MGKPKIMQNRNKALISTFEYGKLLVDLNVSIRFLLTTPVKSRKRVFFGCPTRGETSNGRLLRLRKLTGKCNNCMQHSQNFRRTRAL